MGFRTITARYWVGWALASSSGCKPPAKAVGVQIPPGPPCPVSGHRARLLQDIVHWPSPAERLVVPGWVDSQSPEKLPVVGDDANVGSGDEQVDLPVLVGGADGDVAQPAEVAERDLAKDVDFVATDAVVGRRRLPSGLGLDKFIEDGEWGLSAECSMRSFAVVVVTKHVELKLELGDGASWRLLAEKAFDGLVEALDLATGLRVVWRRVFEDDTQALELQLQ